ncbi:MAG: DUF4176 domain-containing protein [[Clostridium] innocuum]|nr:DUF4176 domain-containing protein [[Clostridium] innocuum]MBS5685866.1 DUF4176 domain-containing protein [[Clostridium] innocuum]
MNAADAKTMLPIGSIVTLEGGSKKLMIIGRCQQNNDELYDYTAVLYPEGMLMTDEVYLFNKADISHVHFTGYQDAEEMQLKEFIFNKLQELDLLDRPEDGQDITKSMT